MWVPGEAPVLRDAKDLVGRALLQMKHECDA